MELEEETVVDTEDVNPAPAVAPRVDAELLNISALSKTADRYQIVTESNQVKYCCYTP